VSTPVPSAGQPYTRSDDTSRHGTYGAPSGGHDANRLDTVRKPPGGSSVHVLSPTDRTKDHSPRSGGGPGQPDRGGKDSYNPTPGRPGGDSHGWTPERHDGDRRDNNGHGYRPNPRDGDHRDGDRRDHDGHGWGRDRGHHADHGYRPDHRGCDRWHDYTHWRPYRPDCRYYSPHPYRYHRSPFWDFRLFLGVFATDDCRYYRSSQLSESNLLGAEIWAADGTFLGVVAPAYDCYESIANLDGPHGDRWSPHSIWNRDCPYGSYYSAQSAWDPDTWTPPRLYRGNLFIGYVTVNTDLYPRVGPAWLARWLLPYDYRDVIYD